MIDHPLAYLITWRTYGSWLHGDDRGSVDREHNRPMTDLVPPNAEREAAMKQRQSDTARTLDSGQRSVVEETLREVCRHRGWCLFAINVRTNHVHLVVGSRETPEKVMNDCKAWATRRLRERGLVDKNTRVWSRHGSTRYLWNEQAVEQACHYTLEGQGTDLHQ